MLARERSQRGWSGWPSTVLVVLLAIGVGAFIVTIDAPGGTDVVTSTHVAIADTYVDASSPGTTHGTNLRVVADSSPTRQTFIRFDLSGLSGPVQSASLRIHVANSTDSQSPSGGTVARVDNTTWSESGTNYNNRPTTFGSNVANLGAVSRNTWVEVPVTAAVSTGGLLTLGIRSTNGDGAYYDSRETGSHAPQLVVTSGSPTSSSSTTSSSSSTTTSSTTTTADPPSNGTTTHNPVADTYVDAGTPTTIYGASSRVVADSSPVRQALLRFDLSALAGPVQSARLRIHVANSTDAQSSNGGNVARVDNTTWAETSTNYNNRPTTWGSNVVGIGAVSRNTWAEVSVTDAVTTGTPVTLGIRSTSSDGAYYDSRESGATAPQLIVTTGTPTPGLNAVDAACAGQLTAANAGPLTDSLINEPSGIDVGVVNPGIYWIHNDSGDSARVFAVDASGVTQRRYTLSGASATDWEDIAIGGGPMPGIPYLYVADIGDNAVSRAEIVVYRVAEPTVTAGSPVTLSGVAALRLRYPDGAHNAESLIVDPQTGALAIIAKSANGGPVNVYAAPGGLVGGSVTILTNVATLALPTGSTNLVTGADVSADGTQVAVRTYAQVLLWNRNPQGSLWNALGTSPCTGPVPNENKGEAIAFHADGRGYVTVNESVRPTLHTYRAP